MKCIFACCGWYLLLGFLVAGCVTPQKADKLEKELEADRARLQMLAEQVEQLRNSIQIMGRALTAEEMEFTEKAESLISASTELLKKDIPAKWRAIKKYQAHVQEMIFALEALSQKVF